MIPYRLTFSNMMIWAAGPEPVISQLLALPGAQRAVSKVMGEVVVFPGTRAAFLCAESIGSPYVSQDYKLARIDVMQVDTKLLKEVYDALYE